MGLGAIFLAEVFIFLNTGAQRHHRQRQSGGVRASAYAVNIFVIHALGTPSRPIVGMVSRPGGAVRRVLDRPGALALAALFCFWGMRSYAEDARA
jgi:hypothetical protein